MHLFIGKKGQPLVLIVLLLACAVCFAGCIGDNGNSSSTSSSSQPAPITPTGALPTCLTVHPPTLVRLADGNYKLVDEIDNCGGKDAGPLKVTAQIETSTTNQSTNLIGLATIPANGKATYNSFTGQASGTNKEIHFPSPSSQSASVTIQVTLNGAVQGEWDGQVTIPAA